MERISSRQNPLVRRFRELSDGSSAASLDVLDILLDGDHLVREAMSSRVRIDVAAFLDSQVDPPLQRLADEVDRSGGRTVAVTAAVLGAMSPVRQPSGVVAIASLSRASLETALERKPQLLFLLRDVQDPGNVGAIVRAAEAYGVTGIISGEGTADPFGWKALRGSMGSTFRVPVVARVPIVDAVRAAKARGIRVLAAVPRDGDALPDTDLRRPTAVVLGGEGQGLPDELLRMADLRVSIPMRKPVESLNVSIAAALIAYEAFRQREGEPV
jgi:RNA methyltransferase, TrmH family